MSFSARESRACCAATLATTLAAGAIFSVLVAGAGWAAAPALLRALAVPPELFVITVRYLRITFLGVPFTCFYNALAAGLKSVGDSKNPLRFLAFSALLNILLDLFFLGVLGFGIACSAATTVAAEAVSAVLAACYLRRLPVALPAARRVEDRPRAACPYHALRRCDGAAAALPADREGVDPGAGQCARR